MSAKPPATEARRMLRERQGMLSALRGSIRREKAIAADMVGSSRLCLLSISSSAELTLSPVLSPAAGPFAVRALTDTTAAPGSFHRAYQISDTSNNYSAMAVIVHQAPIAHNSPPLPRPPACFCAMVNMPCHPCMHRINDSNDEKNRAEQTAVPITHRGSKQSFHT